MARPWYGKEHRRIRDRLIASGEWIGQPCPYCGTAMMPGMELDLAHADDENGRSIPGVYIGLAMASCNQGAGGKVNPWGVRTRAAAAVAARSPARVQQLKDAEARKTRKADRAEFAAAQRAIAADETGSVEDDTDRW